MWFILLFCSDFFDFWTTTNTATKSNEAHSIVIYFCRLFCSVHFPSPQQHKLDHSLVMKEQLLPHFGITLNGFSFIVHTFIPHVIHRSKFKLYYTHQHTHTYIHTSFKRKFHFLRHRKQKTINNFKKKLGR